MKVRQDIEILRVLSAFGIVWFHSGAPGRAFAYSGLVIFIILSVYLSQHGNQHISTRFRIRARLGKFAIASPAEKATVAFAGSVLLIWLFKKYFADLANYVV